MIRRARKEEAAQIAELFMLAWPVEEILESNGLTYEQLHESMTTIAAAEELSTATRTPSLQRWTER